MRRAHAPTSSTHTELAVEEVEEEEEKERLPARMSKGGAQGHKMRGGRRRPRGQHEVL